MDTLFGRLKSFVALFLLRSSRDFRQVIFAALIHDVDHPGVSNAQLVTECDVLAVQYENKSVAEQNSIDLVS